MEFNVGTGRSNPAIVESPGSVPKNMRSSLVSGILLVALSLVYAGDTPAQACPSKVWSTGQIMPADEFVSRLVTIDYDGDDVLDLAGLIQTSPDTLVIWRGLGDGTFSAPTVLLTAPSPASGALGDLATADVNGDGHMDLIVSIWSLLRVYPGNGSGFGTPVELDASYTLRKLVAGNFDSDPAPEVIATATGQARLIIFDNVDGELAETTIVETAPFPGSIASADFDGDGFHDVAVTHGMSTYEGTVELYFGAAGGTFSAPLSLQAGRFSAEVSSADFNGDGHPDLAASSWEDDNITVFLYAGSRQFTSSTLSVDKQQQKSVTAALLLTQDVTGDGIVDVMAAAIHWGNWITTFVGMGDGTFHSPTYLERGDVITTSAVAGDFDLDGDSDVAMAGYKHLTIASGTCASQVDLVLEAPLISTGDEAVFPVAVSGFSSSTQQPYGTITLRNGATDAGTAVLDASGKAVIAVSGLGVGDHTFTAEFSGNADLGAATSAPVVQKVTSATTQTVINTPGTPPVAGTPWRITIAIVGGYTYEWVKLSVDGVVTDRRTAQNIDLDLSPGPHQIFARFSGTIYDPASTSETLNVIAGKATPTLTLTSGAVVKLGQSHALQFSVTGPGGLQPTGMLQLFSGNTLLGSGTVGSVINVTLSPGAHSVRAEYGGDANFNPATLDLTLQTGPNQPLAIEARSLASAIQIAFVLPSGTSAYELNRRPAGTTSWQRLGSWDKTTGLDAFALVRGVVYEYQLEATVDGATMLSNIDGALLFTDDPLIAQATTVKRAHFTEVHDAINVMRTAAGLPAFAFHASFTSDSIIRASHVAALRTALSEACSAMGLSAPTFTHAVSAGTGIRATDMEELRNASR